MTDVEKRVSTLEAFRIAVKAHRNGVEKMKQKAEAIASAFEDICNNNVPYEESVGHCVKKAGVSVTLLSFFKRKDYPGTFSYNMFCLCRMVYDEAHDYLDDDELLTIHECEIDCKHQAEFYYFILSNYKATPKIKKLVQQWKELGPRDSRNTVQNDKFCEIFKALEAELAKDKFKLSTVFVDLV